MLFRSLTELKREIDCNAFIVGDFNTPLTPKDRSTGQKISKDTHRLKVKRWKRIFRVNNREKKVGVAVLVSDKIDFKTKKVRRDKEGHYIMIKGSVQQEDTTIINIYMHPTQEHQHM